MPDPAIGKITAVPRNQGVQVPDALPAPTWVDAKVLAGAAENYAVNTDSDGAKGMIVRICATAVIWGNFNGTAVVPLADIDDGTSSFMIPAGEARVFVFPSEAHVLSLIGTATVSIEAWA